MGGPSQGCGQLAVQMEIPADRFASCSEKATAKYNYGAPIKGSIQNYCLTIIHIFIIELPGHKPADMGQNQEVAADPTN